MNDSENSRNPEDIKKSLDDLVHKLEQDAESSQSWNESVSHNKENWTRIKDQIHERQKALKQLVMDKKAGFIGPTEFDQQYRIIQDELISLEFEVYNMRLGTSARD